MGQAGRRGTFEERQASAIARERSELIGYLSAKGGSITPETGKEADRLLDDPEKLHLAVRRHRRLIGPLVAAVALQNMT